MRTSKPGDILLNYGENEYYVFKGTNPPNPNTPSWSEHEHELFVGSSIFLVVEVPDPMPDGDFVKVLTQQGLAWVYESDFYVM